MDLGARRHWIKACGFRDLSQVEAAIELGVDAIGLNLWPGSPRYLELNRAIKMAQAVQGRAALVAVCVNMPKADLEEVLGHGCFDYAQLHGDESDAYLRHFSGRAFGAVGLGDGEHVDRALAVPGPWVLVDALCPVARGGTGRQIDVELAQRVCQGRPTVLAGGLHAGNVEEVIRECKPMAVDVASGIERAPGDKDLSQLAAFVKAAEAGFAYVEGGS